MKHKKNILFGGSFDPIHNGHLGVGKVVLEKLDGDQLIFVPARRSPHKVQPPEEGHHRMAMIERAIAGCEKFSVSDCELVRDEPSYTLDTIRHFRHELGEAVELYWLIGADQLADFGKWYHVTELVTRCRVAVMHRAGYPAPQFDRLEGVLGRDQIEALKRDVVETPLIDISSTAIRKNLADGRLCEDVLPKPVVRYIEAHRLYGYHP